VPQAAHLFNALIRRGIDDRALYQRALAQVREPGLRALLSENAQALDQLIDDLQAHVRARHKVPASHGTLVGALRGAMADATISRSDQGHRDTAWVRCLARCECALWDRFEFHAQRTPDNDTAQVLRRQLNRLHRIHLDMHCLAGTTHG
jgi:uncharacterized protein (TIGR02284 family)